MEHPKANKEEQDIIRDEIKAYEKEGKDIIYIDESGFAHDMPRSHTNSPVGKRCFGTQDWHAKRSYECHWSITFWSFVNSFFIEL